MKRKTYPLEFKKKVIDEWYIKEKSLKVLSDEYGIAKATINYWIKSIPYDKDNNFTLNNYKILLKRLKEVEKENLKLKTIISMSTIQ